MPVTYAMTKEELGSRLSAGWVYIGQMAMKEGSGIIDPSKPTTPSGATVMNVWLLPEPMIPAGALLQLFAELYDTADKATLNEMARKLYGHTVPELLSAADPQRQEDVNDQEGDANQKG